MTLDFRCVSENPKRPGFTITEKHIFLFKLSTFFQLNDCEKQ